MDIISNLALGFGQADVVIVAGADASRGREPPVTEPGGVGGLAPERGALAKADEYYAQSLRLADLPAEVIAG